MSQNIFKGLQCAGDICLGFSDRSKKAFCFDKGTQNFFEPKQFGSKYVCEVTKKVGTQDSSDTKIDQKLAILSGIAKAPGTSGPGGNGGGQCKCGI